MSTPPEQPWWTVDPPFRRGEPFEDFAENGTIVPPRRATPPRPLIYVPQSWRIYEAERLVGLVTEFPLTSQPAARFACSLYDGADFPAVSAHGETRGQAVEVAYRRRIELALAAGAAVEGVQRCEFCGDRIEPPARGCLCGADEVPNEQETGA